MPVVGEPIVLYSTNTWLGYKIGAEYYKGAHYVWCTPYFDASAIPSIDYSVPPSSSPSEIYRTLREDVKRGDRHSSRIAANKAGLLLGAEQRRAAGDITEEQASEILSIVGASEPSDFRPLLFVIPFGLVRDKLIKVPVGQRAHPLSVEFRVDGLTRECFDIIDLDGGR